MNNRVVLSTAYLPPVNYFSKFFLYEEITIETAEFFVKQSYRSRCSIYGANGRLDLIIPLIHEQEKTPVSEKRIAYDHPWQKIHWRSLQSSYRNSPWFEYFEPEFERMYKTEFEFLIDFNKQLTEMIIKMLKLKVNFSFTEKYEKDFPLADDLRGTIAPKIPLSSDKFFSPKEYYQVFSAKSGFIPGLSIVDLLFNEGLRSVEILKNCTLKP